MNQSVDWLHRVALTAALLSVAAGNAATAFHFYANSLGYELFASLALWIVSGVALAVYAFSGGRGRSFNRRRLIVFFIWLSTPLSSFFLLALLIALH